MAMANRKLIRITTAPLEKLLKKQFTFMSK